MTEKQIFHENYQKLSESTLSLEIFKNLINMAVLLAISLKNIENGERK